MKKICLVISIFLCFQTLPSYAGIQQEERSSIEIDKFIDEFKKSIENRELDRYKQAFSSALKDIEAARFEEFLKQFPMDTISVENISINQRSLSLSRVYLIILFQNSYSVLLDKWQLDVVKISGRWKIIKKDNIGQTQTLYKLKISPARIESVKRVEVKHEDISISFEDPVIFYDNIPKLETALMVIGKGQVEFTPSLPREQHHLELINNKKTLKSPIEHIYLRFSNTFFKNNIKIIKGPKEEKPIKEDEIDLARSLFVKYYPRSFTVRSSLTSELFTILPRTEEVAFEFNTKKLGEISYIYSPFASEEISLYQWKKERVICLYSPPLDDKKRRFFVSFGQRVDIKDYQLDIHFEPRENYFSGKVRIKFESNVGNLNSIRFKLNPKLKILRVNDKDQNELHFFHDDARKTMYIYLLNHIPRGNTEEIDIYYHGHLPPLEEGYEAAQALQVRERAAFVEIKDESYMYSRSSYWYPVSSEEDYFTARLKLVLAPGYSAVSNGKLAGEHRTNSKGNSDREENSVNIFETKKRVKYLAFIVGRLSRQGEVKKPINIDYYRSPKTQDYQGDIFKTAEEIIDFYQNKFGPYPFDKLSIVRQVGSKKGGHSPPGFVVMNDLPRVSGVYFLRTTKSPVNLSKWEEYFLAHEIAHQWWGQGVSPQTYHDQWISEGLAQFSTSLFLREKYGEDDFNDMLKKFSKWTRKNTDWGAIIMGARISQLNFRAYQSVVYNKTALVLNMLKDLVGDEIFFQGLQMFFSRNKYGPANTNTFMGTFDEITEKDLNPFFKSWFHSYHLPEVKIGHFIEKTSTGFILRLSFIQNEPIFVFPLWLEWKENRKRVRRKILVDKKVAEFAFNLNDKPRRILINPNNAVPGKFRVN